MKVSRGTYQRILTSGRKKLTDALVKGKKIKISGGNYVFNCGRAVPALRNVINTKAADVSGGM
jgi:hypothetical protein